MGELGCNKVWEPRAITELYCLLGTAHRAPLTQISLYALTIYLSAVCYPGKLGAPGIGCAHVTCPLMECSLLFNKVGPNIFKPVQSFMHEAYAKFV